MSQFFSPYEERFHAITHGVGAVLAAVGALWLVSNALSTGNPWRVASVAVYGLTLVLLYTASTLYHGARRPDVKARLRVLDHSAIFLLIAGTYTPFLLLPLRGPWGWSLFGFTWACALGGVVYKLTMLDRYPRLSLLLYIGMGWSALLALGPLVQSLSPTTLTWLVAGGVVYTSGAFIHHFDHVRYMHTLWHLFVLVGSACHFVAIAHL